LLYNTLFNTLYNILYNIHKKYYYIKHFVYKKRKYRLILGTVEAVELSLEKSFSDAILARSRSVILITDN